MPVLTETQTKPQLFRTVEDDIMLSVHHHERPSIEHLFKMHRRTPTYPQGVPNIETMREIIRDMTDGAKPTAQRIVPVNPDADGNLVPPVIRSTHFSRKRLKEVFGIAAPRLAKKVTVYHRAHEHSYENSSDLVAYTLTSQTHQLPFAYLPHLCDEKGHLYPRITVEWDGVEAELRPKPDKTICIGKYLNWHEHDMGNETIDVANIVRDATLFRKYLTFQKLIDLGFFKKLGFKGNEVFMTLCINSLKRTNRASRKRIKECLAKFPEHVVDPKRFYFGTKQAFDEHEDDLSAMQFIRADGKQMQLPCYRGLKQLDRHALMKR